jgi:hypothetical protein
MKKLIIICALIVSNASIGQNNLSTNSVLSKANFNYGYLVDYSNSSTNNWSSTFSFYLTNHQFEFGNRTGIARLFENSIGLYNCGYVGYNLIEPISVSLSIGEYMPFQSTSFILVNSIDISIDLGQKTEFLISSMTDMNNGSSAICAGISYIIK